MAKAYATTNGSGYQLLFGDLDLHGLKIEKIGLPFNPWDAVKNLSGGRKYQFANLFEEDEEEDLRYSALEDFHLLASHIKHEMNPDPWEEAFVFRINRSKMIMVKDELFLLHASKIHRKSVSKFNKVRKIK